MIQQPNCFSGFETRIRYVDVKSTPVYFYVQRNSNFNATKTPIPFGVERLNVGGAMDFWRLESSRYHGMEFTNFHSPDLRIFLHLHQELFWI